MKVIKIYFSLETRNRRFSTFLNTVYLNIDTFFPFIYIHLQPHQMCSVVSLLPWESVCNCFVWNFCVYFSFSFIMNQFGLSGSDLMMIVIECIS